MTALDLVPTGSLSRAREAWMSEHTFTPQSTSLERAMNIIAFILSTLFIATLFSIPATMATAVMADASQQNMSVYIRNQSVPDASSYSVVVEGSN